MAFKILFHTYVHLDSDRSEVSLDYLGDIFCEKVQHTYAMFVHYDYEHGLVKAS